MPSRQAGRQGGTRQAAKVITKGQTAVIFLFSHRNTHTSHHTILVRYCELKGRARDSWVGRRQSSYAATSSRSSSSADRYRVRLRCTRATPRNSLSLSLSLSHTLFKFLGRIEKRREKLVKSVKRRKTKQKHRAKPINSIPSARPSVRPTPQDVRTAVESRAHTCHYANDD